ncbi:MAG: hypothetical protein GVY08_12235 [Bacteroidetes bacterium]|nr:hypothetical protein [Bacteroidota bacterium]
MRNIRTSAKGATYHHPRSLIEKEKFFSQGSVIDFGFPPMPRRWRFSTVWSACTPQIHLVNLWGYGHAAPERGWFIPLKRRTPFMVSKTSELKKFSPEAGVSISTGHRPV